MSCTYERAEFGLVGCEVEARLVLVRGLGGAGPKRCMELTGGRHGGLIWSGECNEPTKGLLHSCMRNVQEALEGLLGVGDDRSSRSADPTFVETEYEKDGCRNFAFGRADLVPKLLRPRVVTGEHGWL